MTNEPANDVLVVGAGPCGLLAACELLRRGVRVRLIEKAQRPVPYSKALLLWPRTLDILGELGLAGEVARRSIRIDAFRYYSAKRQLVDVRFPDDLAAQALPQRGTEEMLRDRLRTLGGEIEYGIRLLAFDNLDAADDPTRRGDVVAVLEHADGHVERSTASWVIGADGAGSTVRAELGFPFTGTTYPSHYVLGDARIDGELAPNEAHYFQSPTGVLVIVALPGGLYRFFASVPTEPDEVDLPMVQRLVDERGPGGVTLHDPEWTSAFRVHCRQVERFQLGRVFLVGDAAHVHSPAGGQGLNTGLQDAHNLAWKLGEVVSGRYTPHLLRSYTPERHGVARAVLRDTDIQTKAWTAQHRALVTLRDAAFRIAHRTGLIERGYLPVMAGRRVRYDPSSSTALLAPSRGEDSGVLRVGTAVPPDIAAVLDLPVADPPGWTLVCSDERYEWAGIPDDVTMIVRPALAEQARCRHTAAVVVRPDGVVAARARTADLPVVQTWLASTISTDSTRTVTPGATPTRSA